ncbi:MAG TPA: B-box zinc finger protein, partial [Verrucomicrobiae bacterium]
MKLQCSCGAKYAFDVTPEMARNPVKFICPNCGLDASDYVNRLVRDELASQEPEPPQPDVPAQPAPAVSAPPPAARLRISHDASAPAVAPTSPTPPAPPAPAVGGGTRIRIAREAAPAAAAAPEGATAAASKFCPKHRERATEHCAVCHKPICPKCLEMFGYFCSPLCKGKAEAQNLDVPVYAGRKDLVEAQFWRKTGLVIGSIIGVIVLFFGLWIWYAWFGSVPHKYFAVRFEDNNRAYHGNMQIVGSDQVVFLHGGTLARYNLKTQKPAWSQELISQQDIDAAVKAEADAEARFAAENAGGYTHHTSQADLERGVKRELQAELSLLVSGQNIWVSKEDVMTHFDWETGKVLSQVKLPERTGELTQKGDELLMVGAQSVTHISLASGESRVEKFGPPGASTVAAGATDAGSGLIGLDPNKGQGLDPKKIEAQAQNMKIQGKIALPAVVANAMHEKQIEATLNDDPKHPRAKNAKAQSVEPQLFQLVSGSGSYAQFATKLLEEHFVERSAMKAPPKKSSLDGDLNVTKTAEVA